MVVLQLDELHKEVSLCQAEKGVNQSKVWLIELHPFLHQAMKVISILESCFCITAQVKMPPMRYSVHSTICSS